MNLFVNITKRQKQTFIVTKTSKKFNKTDSHSDSSNFEVNVPQKNQYRMDQARHQKSRP